MAKNIAAVELANLRAKKLGKKRTGEIARQAAIARWGRLGTAARKKAMRPANEARRAKKTA